MKVDCAGATKHSEPLSSVNTPYLDDTVMKTQAQYYMYVRTRIIMHYTLYEIRMYVVCMYVYCKYALCMCTRRGWV